MATSALSDPRDGLWEAAWETFYDTLFEEMATDGLITKWSRFDDITKVLVTMTASGSAISGWTVWNRPGYQPLFLALTGLAAILSLVSTSLAISARIKAHVESNRRFAGLRVDLETFRMKMRVNPDFDFQAFEREFDGYRKRYGEITQLRSSDTFRTNRFDKKIQLLENRKLANQIEKLDVI